MAEVSAVCDGFTTCDMANMTVDGLLITALTAPGGQGGVGRAGAGDGIGRLGQGGGITSSGRGGGVRPR